jgi:hypothetical protein
MISTWLVLAASKPASNRASSLTSGRIGAKLNQDAAELFLQ